MGIFAKAIEKAIIIANACSMERTTPNLAQYLSFFWVKQPAPTKSNEPCTNNKIPSERKATSTGSVFFQPAICTPNVVGQF